MNAVFVGSIIIVSFFSAEGTIHFKNNVCKSYIGYFSRFINKDCFYNNELFLQTPQILDLRKIPYENHTVITEDGYVLSLFRVTNNRPKGIIVMLHPIVQDSTTWFLGGNESYVTVFANAGYELWLVNWRGVTYSDKHVPKIGALQYWNFTFHEIGIYDYSTVFRYVNNITNSTLIAFSMSIGSSAATIYAAEKPEEASKLVKVFVAMAVPAFMQDSNSAIRLFIPLIPLVKILQRIFGFGEFFQRPRWLFKIIARILILFNAEWLCGIVATPFVGGSPLGINPLLLPMGLSITPEAVSLKTLYHFAQLLTNGNQFLQYDYGKTKNLLHYNSTKPPSYQIENINVPFYIIYGEKDNLANAKGNVLLYNKLPDAVKLHGSLEVPGCSHADFLIGKQAPYIVQNNILGLLEKI